MLKKEDSPYFNSSARVRSILDPLISKDLLPILLYERTIQSSLAQGRTCEGVLFQFYVCKSHLVKMLIRGGLLSSEHILNVAYP